MRRFRAKQKVGARPGCGSPPKLQRADPVPALGVACHVALHPEVHTRAEQKKTEEQACQQQQQASELCRLRDENKQLQAVVAGGAQQPGALLLNVPAWSQAGQVGGARPVLRSRICAERRQGPAAAASLSASWEPGSAAWAWTSVAVRA